MIPLSNKDAEDLRRQQLEQEDQRRRTSIQGKSTVKRAVQGPGISMVTQQPKRLSPSQVPNLYPYYTFRNLKRMMQERPLGVTPPRTPEQLKGKTPDLVVRVKDPKTGKYVNRRVSEVAPGTPKVVSSIKFIEGNVYVNGDFAPELTNTLKSVIKGTVQLPDGKVPKQVYGQPTFIGQAPQQVSSLSADGVRITDSLVRTYVTQLEKQSGRPNTLLPSEIRFGPQLYERLFGAEQDVPARTGVREPNVINVRKLAANLYADEKFTPSNLPKDAVYVGRQYSKGKYQLPGSKWGNPFRVGPDGNLEQVLDKYEGWARTQMAKNPNWLDPLINKDLVDWCEPGKCHADVLKKLIKEKVGDFERAPLGKAALTDLDKARERYNELNDKKTRLGAGSISKAEAKELNRLEEYIRKATTVEPKYAGQIESIDSELKPKKEFSREVFVFGSNEKGIHGKGAALTAVEEYGAVRGQGVGLQGSSYAIPTKSTPSQSLSLPEIKKYVDDFIRFAKNDPETKFNLTAIGTGLAGYKASDIAPLFADAPDNVILPDKFKAVLTPKTTRVEIVKVEGGNKGKGTPMGDAKDVQMRKIASAAIVELEDLNAQNKITARVPNGVGKTSSETSLLQLGPVDDNLSGKTIMLARNGKLSNKPLRPETIAQITKAAQAGANFVVGDMPGVDSEFIKLLDKLNASYKVYHTGDNPRITPSSETPKTTQKPTTRPETKLEIKNVGDTKAPGIYTNGKYNSAVTYAAIQAMVKAKESKSYWQTIARQGGIRIGGVFVSVDDMQTLAKSIPADTEVVYNKSGNPTVKPRTTGGGAFGIGGRTLGTLGIVASIGDLLRLSKEWSTPRKVPVS